MRTEEEWKNLEAERNAFQDQCISLKHKAHIAEGEHDALMCHAKDTEQKLLDVLKERA